ncbi:MAG: orotidine-5'-phosphate decarboxylase [Chlamydiae bacterium CG10_big_fil_rev_8_21_14_0_10_42_34]|nr:MAG: orotidine-5'-phosphate decarboxylase [Chlamydiae bacterium CG10_big_fil_rev_8_21_14_0_10_42_34]
MKLSFLKRSSLTLHPTAQKLFKLMSEKKTNLCIALDVTEQNQLLEMADELGPELCVLKTHVDILKDFTPDFGDKLKQIAKKHRFFIFEDRKFADIGQTVSLQYHKGIYQIAKWADIVNAHIVPGPGIIEGLKDASLLLLAEMSSAGTVAKGTYTRKAVLLAEKNPKTVMGFICLKKISQKPGFIHFTPGVKLKRGKDSLGQRYRTVEEVLIKNQSDIIIVGRDITTAQKPLKQAALYRERAWEAHVQAIS